MLVIVTKYLLPAVQLLNFFPGAKRIVGGLLAFLVGALAAWNGAVGEAGFTNLVWELPGWLKDIVVAVLGIGVAAGVANDAKKPDA